MSDYLPCSHRSQSLLALALTMIALFAQLSHAAHPGVIAAFGASGFAVTATPSHVPATGWGSAHSETVRSDSQGRILVASQIMGSMAVTRLLPNGQVDASFAAGAVVVRPSGIDYRAGFGLDAFDRPIFAYVANRPTYENMVVLYRFTVNGAPDFAFGQGGRAEVNFGARIASYSAGGYQPITAQNIVGRPSGGVFVRVGSGGAVAVAEDGTLDTSYRGTGVVDLGYSVFGSAAYENQIAGISASGALYTTRLDANNGGFLLSRLLADGSIDAAYGAPNGTRLPGLGGAFVDSFLTSDGALIWTSYSSVKKINSAGFLDTSFGIDGFADFSPHVFNWGGSIQDVSATGEVLLAYDNQGLTQYTTAETRFVVLKRDGTVALDFGGRGATRFEQGSISGGFVARRASFDRSGGGVFVVGLPSGEQTTAMIVTQLARSFRHQLTISQFASQPSLPTYGVEYAISFQYQGDQGDSGAAVTISNSDGACSVSIFRAVGYAQQPYLCGKFAPHAAGLLTSTLTFPGDDIYEAQAIPTPPFSVAKGIWSAAFSSGPFRTLPKDRFFVSFAAAPNFVAPSPYASTGHLEITDGERGCQVPLPTNYYVALSCTFSLATVGNRTLRLLYKDDPNFEEDTGARLAVDVMPPKLAMSFNTVFGTPLQFAMESNDTNCGLKLISLTSVPNLGNLSPEFLRSRRRSGVFGVTTVDDCAPGFSGTILVSTNALTDSIAGLYGYSRLSGWSALLPSNKIDFVDGGELDSLGQGRIGLAGLAIVVNVGSEDMSCLFDRKDFAVPRDGIVLSRYAQGFRGNQITDGLGAIAAAQNYWVAIAQCVTCLAEIDIDGDGAFTLNDAVMISRYKLGFAGSSITNGLGMGAAPRSLTQMPQYLLNGCR